MSDEPQPGAAACAAHIFCHLGRGADGELLRRGAAAAGRGGRNRRASISGGSSWALRSLAVYRRGCVGPRGRESGQAKRIAGVDVRLVVILGTGALCGLALRCGCGLRRRSGFGVRVGLIAGELLHGRQRAAWRELWKLS